MTYKPVKFECNLISVRLLTCITLLFQRNFGLVTTLTYYMYFFRDPTPKMKNYL